MELVGGVGGRVDDQHDDDHGDGDGDRHDVGDDAGIGMVSSLEGEVGLIERGCSSRSSSDELAPPVPKPVPSAYSLPPVGAASVLILNNLSHSSSSSSSSSSWAASSRPAVRPELRRLGRKSVSEESGAL